MMRYLLLSEAEYPVEHAVTNYYQVCSSAQPSITTSARGERLQPRPGHSGSRLAQAVIRLVSRVQNYFYAILFSPSSDRAKTDIIFTLGGSGL